MHEDIGRRRPLVADEVFDGLNLAIANLAELSATVTAEETESHKKKSILSLLK